MPSPTPTPKPTSEHPTAVWEFAAGTNSQWGGAFSWSSPRLVDGFVYVGSDKKVFALSATNGIKLWDFTTGGVVYSSPAVVDGVVYVGSDDDKVC